MSAGEGHAAGKAAVPGSDRLALAALSLLAALAGLQKAVDPDLWWHLAGGRLVLATGIPGVNTFSHTNPDAPWRYTQWLFGVLVRALELAAGPATATLLAMLLAATAVALTLDTVRRRAGSLPLAPLAPLLLLALSASRVRIVPRPHLATYVGLALLLNLRERGGRRLPLWFLLIGLLWANLHAGVVFGLALAALMPIADLAAGERARARSSLAAAGAFFAGSLANPYGFYPYRYAFEHLRVQEVVMLDEFRHAAWPAEATFFVLAALALLALPFALRRRDLLFCVGVPLFLALAVNSVRLVPKFLIVALPGLGALAVDLWARAGRRRAARGAAFALALTLIAGSLALAVRDWRQTRHFNPPGYGVDERMLPEGAARFILERGLSGPMYNDFDQGGYLAWRLYPPRRVFVDGRVQAYPPEFFSEFESAMAGRGWGAFLASRGVDYAVVQRRPYGSRIDLAPFFEALGWPLAYFDGVSYLYVRPGSAAAESSRDSWFSLVRPRLGDEELAARSRANPAASRAELARVEPGRLIELQDFQSLGVMAAVAGDAALAERFLRAGTREYPRNALLRLNLGTALLILGREEEGLAELDAAAGLSRGTPVEQKALSRRDEVLARRRGGAR